MATAAVAGVEALEGLFGRYLPQLVLAVVVPVAVLVLVASLDLVSAGLMLLTLPLVPVFFWLIGRSTANRARERWQAMSLLASHFLDVVRGLPTLRAFNRGEAQIERIERVSDEYRSATMGTLRLAFLSGTVLELAATLGVALVAVTVGVRLVDGGIAFEPALTVLVLAPELYLPLRNLAAGFHASADGAAVADAPAHADRAAGRGGRRLRRRPGPARRHRSGSRPSRSPIPTGPPRRSSSVALEIAPGETFALVGPSGGGKSTLASLLLRFHAPADGRILVGDVDLADCDPAAWRRQIAWVPQSPTLFRGTVADNIRLGDPTASDERVQLAAHAGRRGLRRREPAGRLRHGGRRGRTAAVDRRAPAHRTRPRVPPRRAARRARRADREPRSRRARGRVGEAIERLGRGRTMLLIAHDADLAAQADRVVTIARGPHRGGTGMSATLTTAARSRGHAEEARGSLDRARRADGAPRGRADRDLGLSRLPRRGAAADPLSHRRRSSPFASSVSRGRSPATSTASSRTISRFGHSDASGPGSTRASSRSRRPSSRGSAAAIS